MSHWDIPYYILCGRLCRDCRKGESLFKARVRAAGLKSCHSDQQKRNEPCVHSASAFLQRKTMKLCPKTAPAPVAQRGGAGFPEARMRALGVPGSVPQVQVLERRPNTKKPCKPCAYRVFAICVQEPPCAPKRYFFGLYPNGCRCSRWFQCRCDRDIPALLSAACRCRTECLPCCGAGRENACVASRFCAARAESLLSNCRDEAERRFYLCKYMGFSYRRGYPLQLVRPLLYA